MALLDVGQATMLANEIALLLEERKPSSVALIGCAGGNGFVQVAQAGVSRLVGIDINPKYVAYALARFGDQFPTYCADIEQPLPRISPVALIYPAFVFECVDIAKAMLNLRELCLPGERLATLL